MHQVNFDLFDYTTNPFLPTKIPSNIPEQPLPPMKEILSNLRKLIYYWDKLQVVNAGIEEERNKERPDTWSITARYGWRTKREKRINFLVKDSHRITLLGFARYCGCRKRGEPITPATLKAYVEELYNNH